MLLARRMLAPGAPRLTATDPAAADYLDVEEVEAGPGEEEEEGGEEMRKDGEDGEDGSNSNSFMKEEGQVQAVRQAEGGDRVGEAALLHLLLAAGGGRRRSYRNTYYK